MQRTNLYFFTEEFPRHWYFSSRKSFFQLALTIQEASNCSWMNRLRGIVTSWWPLSQSTRRQGLLFTVFLGIWSWRSELCIELMGDQCWIQQRVSCCRMRLWPQVNGGRAECTIPNKALTSLPSHMLWHRKCCFTDCSYLSGMTQQTEIFTKWVFHCTTQPAHSWHIRCWT